MRKRSKLLFGIDYVLNLVLLISSGVTVLQPLFLCIADARKLYLKEVTQSLPTRYFVFCSHLWKRVQSVLFKQFQKLFLVSTLLKFVLTLETFFSATFLSFACVLYCHSNTDLTIVNNQ